MKKPVLVILILIAWVAAHGQNFELKVNAKLGYYFPANTE